jgi:hypothetical protein
MTWIVRNTLRGTLELHGFLENDKPIRIAGGELFDLDSISDNRQYVESSRQIEIAFREGYFKTISKDEEFAQDEITEIDLSPWQEAVQKQMNLQTQNVEVITAMLKNLLDSLSRADEKALDEGRLVSLLKSEIQQQIKLMMRGVESAPSESYSRSPTEKEAVNQARLYENVTKGMEVEFDPGKIKPVKTLLQGQQHTSHMVDLLNSMDKL